VGGAKALFQKAVSSLSAKAGKKGAFAAAVRAVKSTRPFRNLEEDIVEVRETV